MSMSRLTRRLGLLAVFLLAVLNTAAVGAEFNFARYKETDLDEKTFPATCPYSWDDLVSREFRL